MLQLDQVTKHYDDDFALSVSLAINAGEFASILGPSGCGKTSLLRLIAGLERPDSGTISIAGRDVTCHEPHRRGVGLVFQDYALFPHMSAGRNVEYGLRMCGVHGTERARRTAEALELVGLPRMEDRDVATLSGGERQRIALARAIVTRPSVLLLDEPFSALDQHVRLSLRREVRRLQRQLRMTMVFVTHSQEEALSLSDSILVMSRGRVEQVGAPREVYAHPSSLYTAEFMGELNRVEGTLEERTEGTSVASVSLRDGARIVLDALAFVVAPIGARVILAFRPEDASCTPTGLDIGGGPSGLLTVRGTVVSDEFRGPFSLCHTDTPVGRISAVVHQTRALRVGELVQVAVQTSSIMVFPADPSSTKEARAT